MDGTTRLVQPRRSHDVERVLTMLGGATGPTEVDPQSGDNDDELPGYIADARAICRDLLVVRRTAASLPVSRCHFVLECIEPWNVHARSLRRRAGRARDDLYEVARSTPPSSERRAQALLPAFQSYGMKTAESLFMKSMQSPLKSARLASAVLRTVILGLLVLIGKGVEDTFDVPWSVSIGVALGVFLVVDLGLVDYVVEPFLEKREYRALDAAMQEVISRCCMIQGIDPTRVASLQEGTGRSTSERSEGSGDANTLDE